MNRRKNILNNTYITLLSSTDYLPAVLILNQNLKDLKSRYPLTVLVTDDIISEVNQYLFKAHIRFYTVPRLSYSQDTIQYWKNISSTVLNTASKIQLFNLKQYNKIVYIDADSIFLQNPDILFNMPDGSMYDDHDQIGFSGLFVCCPQNHRFDYYKSILENVGGLDGDLLGNLWFPFRTNANYKIDYSWFINIVTLTDDINKINGIHFCNKYKPWNYNNADKYVQDLNNQFPNTSNDNRLWISKLYITKYLIPLKQKFDF